MSADAQSDSPISIDVWLTSADQSQLLQQIESRPFGTDQSDAPLIAIDVTQRLQTIEGFGFSLTGGSAMLIQQLPEATRRQLLEELFLPSGIGVSFLRLSIGASDLSEQSYSYDEVADDDFELRHFDLQAGDRQVVPLLQEILVINPEIKIIATPWSAPRWMKSNRAWVGGSLRDDCLAVYAAYFVRYLLAMRDHGIVIHAVTPQNEPQNHKNDPSMVMSAEQQASFVKQHLGPALATNGLAEVEIFCWDHNCDVSDFALSLFADSETRRYLSGSAWHLYGGDISLLSEIHQAYPEMKLYFTEQWVGSDGQFGGDLMWHIRHVLIGALRNWSNIVLEWNLASDPNCRPHTAGGEARCVGALTIDGDNVTRNVAYYIIGHAAKWLRPGSVRIQTDDQAIPNVAFLSPDQQIVMIALNDSVEIKAINIVWLGQTATLFLPGESVVTFVWNVTPAL